MLNIKKGIDKSGPFIIEKLGHLINPFILNFKRENNKLLIFYFHGLYESTTQKNLNHADPQNNITVNQFADFIDYFLSHNYHFIKAEDILQDLQKDLPYIMITFDDGYFNNTLAVKILNKYKIPATFFITTMNVLQNKSYWWDIIYKYRIREGVSLETIRYEQAQLKSFKFPYIENYIEQNFGTKSTEPWSDIDRPMSVSELKEISQNPFVSIGNHTHNHAILPNYSKEEIKEEFCTSNRILSDLIGKTPISVAFPNGNFNRLTMDVAEEEGFRFAFSTQNHLNRLPVKDGKIICLNRFMAKTTNIKRYGSFIRLGYSPDLLYYNLKKRTMFRKN